MEILLLPFYWQVLLGQAQCPRSEYIFNIMLNVTSAGCLNKGATQTCNK